MSDSLLGQPGANGADPPPPTGTDAPPAFAELLPEELRTHPTLSDVKDVGGLARAFIDTKSLVGRSVRIPGDDASDEDRAAFYQRLVEVPGVLRVPDSPDDADGWQAFYAQLGRPERPEAYKFDQPGDLPEGLKYDVEREQWFRGVAHQAGLSQQQAEGLMKAFGERELTEHHQSLEAKTNALGELKREWGPAYQRNVNIARTAIREFGGDALVGELERAGLANSPKLAQVFHSIGAAMLEDGAISGAPAAGLEGTRTDIQSKINDIKGNQKHPYWDQKHPGHEAATKTMNALYQQLSELSTG